MKKIICIFLLLTVILFQVNVFAEDNKITLNVTESTLTNVNPGSMYGDVYALDNGRYVEFNVTAPKTGVYGISLFGGSCGINAIVTVNSTQVSNTFVDNLEVIEGWQNNMSDVSLGTVSLNADTSYRIRVTFSINNTECILLKSISLQWLRDIGLFIDSVKSGDVTFGQQTVIPKGSDNILVNFTEDVNPETISTETMKLTGPNGDVSTKLTTNGRAVEIALRETLAADSEYQLHITGVKDISDTYTITDTSYIFSTGGADKGTATVKNLKAEILHENLILSGQMLSSVGVGIRGRNITVGAIELPNLLFQGITGEDGQFYLTFRIPSGTASGSYNFSITFEYMSTQFYTMSYVTPTDEQQILNAISATTNAADVYNVLNQYKTSLGINLVRNLADIADKNKVYEVFIGKTFSSVSELLEIYKQRIIIETVNQTTDISKIESIFKSNEKVTRIGVNYEKVSYIDTQKVNFYNNILSLSPISDANIFATTISDLVDKWLAIQYGKSDCEVIMSDRNVYIGQSCNIPLKLSNTVNEIKTIELELTSDNNNLFEGAKFTSSSGVDKEYGKGRMKLIITPSASSIDTLGELSVLNTDDEGTYSLTVTGRIVYQNAIPVEIKTNILPKTISVKVTENKKKGGGNASSHQEGGGTPSRGNVVLPPVTDNTNENKTENNENIAYNFIDLEDVKWAKEGVQYLVSRNIIAKAEDKNFRPHDKVTREEFIKMVVNALGLYNKEAKGTFSDIDKNHWSYEYISSAQENGIVMGNEDNQFGMGTFITREDISVIICRALKKAGYTQSEKIVTFSDDEMIANYAKDSVYMIRDIGIINGMGDNLFAPKDYTSRAQIAKIIYSLMKVVGK